MEPSLIRSPNGRLRYALGAGWHPKRGKLDDLAATGLQKLLLIHAPETIDNIQVDVERRFGSEMYVVRTENEILEVAAPDINKAIGAQAVAKMLGIASQRCGCVWRWKQRCRASRVGGSFGRHAPRP